MTSPGWTLPFTGPWLLAPMEGVTEPCFRDIVLAANPASDLGGAFTEFVRVANHPIPVRRIRQHLGSTEHEAPVGVQIMGADAEMVALTAHNAVRAGAPIIDLNFGCPAKGALRGCAGSAMLQDPSSLEMLVRTVRDAVPDRPVTAKVRAGYDDAERIEEIARAAENGGAALLTIHCRTRKEAYCDETDWSRIRRAVEAVSIPVCGNGGIWKHADLERMRHETGCRYAMVGRAALGDPWIFSGRTVTAGAAARFLLEYGDALSQRYGARPRKLIGRMKQLFKHWTAGDLLGADPESWLRETDPDQLLGRLRRAAESDVDARAT